MQKKLNRLWRRLWSYCWFRHVGHRVRVYRDNQLFIECGECGLEISHVLPGQVPRICHAIDGRPPITTKGELVKFRRKA